MLTKLIQKVKAGFQTHERELFIVLLVILLGALSFGLGRLSLLWQKHEPIRIEKSETAEVPRGSVEAASIAVPLSPPPAAPIVTPPPPKTTGTFVASKKGTAYHFPWCPGAKQIKEENKIWFETKAEAERFGYKPAANCPGL